MKILLVNKFHYQRDGVTTHYFALAKLLKAHGHEVAFFSTAHPNSEPSKWSRYFVSYRDLEQGNGILNNIANLFPVIYNREAKRNMRAILRDFKPDIVHLHNIYYHLTPSIIDEVKRQGIPLVMTLHDYKLVSPNYNLFLNGSIWEASKPHKFYRAIVDKAIKNSYSKSFVAVLEQYIHFLRNSYGSVNIFISPSDFLKNKFSAYGFSQSITVLPNPILNAARPSASPDKEYFLYYGRLSAEKGVMVALQALARYRDFELVVAGSGAQEQELKAFVAHNHLEKFVMFKGFQKGANLTKLIRESRAVLVPSLWYENFPYTVLESLAMGKIVIASAIGGIPELISNGKNGFLVKPGSVESLHKAMSRVKQLSANTFLHSAVASVEQYTPKKFYRQLMDVYDKALVH